MLKFIKTSNGNYFVATQDVPCFVDSKGNWLRDSNWNEWNNAWYNWDGAERGEKEIKVIMPKVINLNLEIRVKRVYEDYSKFKLETSTNGGDYGFWVNLNTIVFEGERYSWETEHTTAEFEYDQLNGRFQQGLQCYDIVIRKEGRIYNTGAYIRTQPQNIKGEYFELKPVLIEDEIK